MIIYDATDFRIGASDKFRCGGKNDPKYIGESRYLQIRPEVCIVYSETIDADGRRLSASLNTVEFQSVGARTALKLTVHVAAFEGRDMIDGTKFGHNAALNNLSNFLDAAE